MLLHLYTEAVLSVSAEFFLQGLRACKTNTAHRQCSHDMTKGCNLITLSYTFSSPLAAHTTGMISSVHYMQSQ